MAISLQHDHIAATDSIHSVESETGRAIIMMKPVALLLLGMTIPMATAPNNAVQRIDPLWMVVVVNQGGVEQVVQAKMTTGEYAPLMATDRARLENITAAAREIAQANQIKLTLVKFSNRSELEEFGP